jgi:hypothetical protein
MTTTQIRHQAQTGNRTCPFAHDEWEGAMTTRTFLQMAAPLERPRL